MSLDAGRRAFRGGVVGGGTHWLWRYCGRGTQKSTLRRRPRAVTGIPSYSVSIAPSPPFAPGRSEARKWLADAALVGVVALVQVGGTAAIAAHRGLPVNAGALVLLGAGALLLLLRRRFPVWVLAATYATTFGVLALGVGDGPVWASVIAAFATAIYMGRRPAAVFFLVACYVGYLWGPPLVGAQRAPSAVFALSLGIGLGALLGGSEWLRLRRQRSQAVSSQLSEQERRQESEERVRIARDLHDIVAHNISVINVQANTALHLMDREPERARLALTTIHQVSKQALVELRSVLGVLRDSDLDAPRSPAPGLAGLDQVLANGRAAGLDVEFVEEGAHRMLPAEVETAAYRIIQESLTNAARHSGGRHVKVLLSYSDHEISVEVSDDGRRNGDDPAIASGRGILGMTERARSLGGDLVAGAAPAGGFSVRARLPTDGAAL